MSGGHASCTHAAAPLGGRLRGRSPRGPTGEHRPSWPRSPASPSLAPLSASQCFSFHGRSTLPSSRCSDLAHAHTHRETHTDAHAPAYPHRPRWAHAHAHGHGRASGPEPRAGVHSHIRFASSPLQVCWDCYDFEAAAAHEVHAPGVELPHTHARMCAPRHTPRTHAHTQVGHLLGLGHSDGEPASELVAGYTTPGNVSYNALLAAGTMFNASTCLHPWDYVREGVPPDYPTGKLTSRGVRPSMMETFTAHNPHVCLSQVRMSARTLGPHEP